MGKKRLRIFAGPNGSGKSTITSIVTEAGIHLGHYVNADELKNSINKTHLFDFGKYSLDLKIKDFLFQFKNSSLYTLAGGNEYTDTIESDGNKLIFQSDVNDYFASFLAAYIRDNLLNNCDKFTFETVMSHPSKLDFLLKAKALGYKIYLYFVALENPILNCNRVKARASQGGHDVPKTKVIERYARTMNLIIDALRIADTTYFFDNSYSQPKLFASVENNCLKIADNIEYIPLWFSRYVIEKIQ